MVDWLEMNPDTRPVSIAGPDSRLDLGYGTLNPKFNKSRSFSQYESPPVEDPEAEEEIDDETYLAVMDRLLNYKAVDPYMNFNTDPFHYVDGATKISELSTAKGMVPFPRMYKDKQAVAGGTAQRLPAGPTLGFRTRIEPTGTKKGFSQAPYPIPELEDVDEPNYFLSDIISQNPDVDNLKHVRDLVSLIHWEQEKESNNS